MSHSHVPAGRPEYPAPGTGAGAQAKWNESMVEWGKAVRDDIIRLEGAAGISSGDPGDPPPPPK